MTNRLQNFFYKLLFSILGFSGTFYILSLVYHTNAWKYYSGIYVSILVVDVWYTYILLFYWNIKKTKYPEYAGEKISVIVPCYNEKWELLKEALLSVIRAKGNKEIIVVDDGSKNDIFGRLRLFLKDYDIKIFSFEKNKGKRHAIHHAVKKMISDSDFVVTIDSDTIIDEDALIKLVEPLKDQKIGASTGDVRLLNEKTNLLTRMVGVYYWIGLNIYKKAQSSMGMVTCCSGCLAAYRTDILKSIADEFVNQEFFGERCTHSEDRHLTNLVLRDGFKVVYVDKAISYTSTPDTVNGFLRQQQRWKRGYIRESLFTLNYAWKTKPLLFFQILFWDLTAPFFAFGMMLGLVITLVGEPKLFLYVVLPSWILFMLARFIHVILYAKEKIVGLFVYMFFYDIFLYWQFVYALFTVQNKSWMTRRVVPQ